MRTSHLQVTGTSKREMLHKYLSLSFMSSIRHNLLYLFVLACIQIIGIGLFAKGFFPYKIYLSGFATQQDVPLSLADDLHKHYWQEPVFDRLAFIVIDALRK